MHVPFTASLSRGSFLVCRRRAGALLRRFSGTSEATAGFSCVIADEKKMIRVGAALAGIAQPHDIILVDG
jgi:hypothetical protein